jgi:3-deoxy-D-manno-octulosonic-acid transferase
MRADPIERVLRGLYSAALYLLLPVTVYHLIWRSFRQGEYLQRWNERYAVYGTAPRHDATVWVHAVSVGEVNAAAPLIDALRTRRPDLRLLVTSITPTGSARIRALWGDAVDHVYLPYDLPGAVSRFLRHFRPRLALVLETELWPNLMFGCREHGVPAWIVNARLSERSLRGYRTLRPLLWRALRTLRGVLAQSTGDALRFVRLGADPASTRNVGNLKYDVAAGDGGGMRFAEAFRERTGPRPAWIAASTHPEEEAAVVAIHRQLRGRWPDLLLLWAPRHPERFRPVAQQSVEAGWRVATRQLTHWPDRDDAVFVVDTLGELVPFYACAQVAFVGGSLQDIGGHNLLEPAAAGTAVVTGPHLRNFTDIAGRMRAAGALRVGEDAGEVGRHIAALLADAEARAAMVAAAHALVEEGRGALNRTLDLVAADLPPP